MTSRRIGLLVPSSNTVMEPDFCRAFQGLATVHTARMYLEDPITIDGELRLLDEYARPAARDLGTIRPDCAVFGCTSAGSLRGPEADQRLRAELSELAKAPVVGVIDSLGASLRARGLKRITVLTPYSPQLNRPIRTSLTADGFDVVRIIGFGLSLNLDIGNVSPEAIYERAVNSPLAEGCEALAIACTNFRALEAKWNIEQQLSIPVVTANSAVIEQIRGKLGLNTSATVA